MKPRFLTPLFDAPADDGAEAPVVDETPVDDPWMDEDLDDDKEFKEAMAKIYAEDNAEEETPAKPEAKADDEPETDPEEVAEEPKAEAEPEVEEAPAPDFSLFREILPDAVIESEDDARQHLSRLRESDEILQEFETLTAQDENLLAYLKLRKEGVIPRLAVTEAFGDLASVPDPDEDPEAYAEYKAREAVKAEQKKYQTQQQTTEETQRQARAQEAQKVFAAAEKRNAWDEERADEIARVYSQLTTGDPNTGRFRSDTFDIIDQGLRYKETVSAVDSVIQKALKEGPAAVKDAETDTDLIKSVKAALRDSFARGARKSKETARALGHVPNFDGARKAGKDLTPAERERKHLENAFTTAGDIDWD